MPEPDKNNDKNNDNDKNNGNDNDNDNGNDILLQCEQLVIGYRGAALLPPLDLAIRRGSVLLVVGRNGAGKSTWLKTVLGLIPAVRGRIREPGNGRPDRVLRKAYVPQSAALDELLPVRASTVVGWGQLRGWNFLRPFVGAGERRARIQALERAEAGAFAGQPFAKLSGGQRQRVLFARLLAGKADIALLDEPTASMDMASEKQTYERLASLAREQGMAVVVVTHTISTAAHYADAVLFLDRGHGHGQQSVVEYGPPRQVFEHEVFKYYFGDIAMTDELPDELTDEMADELAGEMTDEMADERADNVVDESAVTREVSHGR